MPPSLTPMRRRIDADRARLLGKNKNTMTDVDAMLLGSYSNWISLNDQRMLSGSPAIKAQMKQMMHQIMQLESMTSPKNNTNLYPIIKPNNNNNKKPVIIPIAGDGRCLFRSIARAAYSPKNQAEETKMADDLRREAQRIICDDPQLYAFIMGDMNGGRAKYANANRNVGEYCRRVREKRSHRRPSPSVEAVNSWEWGGVVEVHVLSFVLERAIFVYEEETMTGSGKYALVDVAGADLGRPIHLWYNGRNHYQLFAVPPRAADIYSNIPSEAAPYIVGAGGNNNNNKNKKSNSNSNNSSSGFRVTTPALTIVRPTVRPPRNGS